MVSAGMPSILQSLQPMQLRQRRLLLLIPLRVRGLTIEWVGAVEGFALRGYADDDGFFLIDSVHIAYRVGVNGGRGDAAPYGTDAPTGLDLVLRLAFGIVDAFAKEVQQVLEALELLL